MVWEVGDPEAGPRVKSEGTCTVRVMPVLCTLLPEVPLTVTE
jgi:hypothetical protein